MDVTSPQGGRRQEPTEEEMTKEESSIVFRCQELWSKKSQWRPALLRLMSPARDATNDPVPLTMGGGPTVEHASGQVAITQAVVSIPDSIAAPRPMTVTNKQAVIVMEISLGKEKIQWQDVPLPPKSPKRRKTMAKRPDWAPVSPVPS
ncbi:hypothetical protein R1flu_006642 [Riccia fluitans]|uniref:Uncharacterized protein n=1 Tax=Riccia fluitans TaxID=41844 RepID=A0ABD1YWL4_9MARC